MYANLFLRLRKGYSGDNPSLSEKDKVAQETLKAVLEDLYQKLVTKKEYSVRLATGLAGFVPILEYFTNAYDIALNTKEFLQDKKHWLSFFTSLRDVKG